MRPPSKPFTVEKRRIEPKEPRAGARFQTPPVVDPAKVEEKRRERHFKGFASEAFRLWRPG